MKFCLHSVLFRFPFDWKNPLGYFVAVAFQYIATSLLFAFVSCMMSFEIGAFFMELLLTNDIKSDLKLFNENAMVKDNRSLAFKRFGDFIENHWTLKQLSVSITPFYAGQQNQLQNYFFIQISRLLYEFSDLHQLTYVLLFSWSLIAMCSALLMIQTQIVKC